MVKKLSAEFLGSLLLAANAAMTEAGGGSHGVPIERSISPPSNGAAKGLKESKRS